MNDILHLSGATWLHAAVVALAMLGLGLEGMGSDEEPLHTEAER